MPRRKKKVLPPALPVSKKVAVVKVEFTLSNGNVIKLESSRWPVIIHWHTGVGFELNNVVYPFYPDGKKPPPRKEATDGTPRKTVERVASDRRTRKTKSKNGGPRRTGSKSRRGAKTKRKARN